MSKKRSFISRRSEPRNHCPKPACALPNVAAQNASSSKPDAPAPPAPCAPGMSPMIKSCSPAGQADEAKTAVRAIHLRCVHCKHWNEICQGVAPSLAKEDEKPAANWKAQPWHHHMQACRMRISPGPTLPGCTLWPSSVPRLLTLR